MQEYAFLLCRQSLLVYTILSLLFIIAKLGLSNLGILNRNGMHYQLEGGQEHQSDCATVRNQQFVDDRSRS